MYEHLSFLSNGIGKLYDPSKNYRKDTLPVLSEAIWVLDVYRLRYYSLYTFSLDAVYSDHG